MALQSVENRQGDERRKSYCFIKLVSTEQVYSVHFISVAFSTSSVYILLCPCLWWSLWMPDSWYIGIPYLDADLLSSDLFLSHCRFLESFNSLYTLHHEHSVPAFLSICLPVSSHICRTVLPRHCTKVEIVNWKMLQLTVCMWGKAGYLWKMKTSCELSPAQV